MTKYTHEVYGASGMKTINVPVTDVLHRRLKAEAASRGIYLGAFIVIALEGYLSGLVEQERAFLSHWE